MPLAKSHSMYVCVHFKSFTMLCFLCFFLTEALIFHKVCICFPVASFIMIPRSVQFSSVQFSSITQLCPTLCDPMNHSTPGLPVHYQLPEFIQTHIYRDSNAIQPSHPLSSPSLPAPNPYQHQGLF